MFWIRIWSINLRWLDNIGLVALWRESLLARTVLEGKTKGYVNHPQLIRFRSCSNPPKAINTYLLHVFSEASARGFSFDKTKINNAEVDEKIRLPINQGQLDYELMLLKYKLAHRSPEAYEKIKDLEEGEPNALFTSRSGPAESWERIKAIKLS